jgi:hypothetical protein
LLCCDFALLDDDNIKSALGELKRCRNARNAATDHDNRGAFREVGVGGDARDRVHWKLCSLESADARVLPSAAGRVTLNGEFLSTRLFWSAPKRYANFVAND